MAEKKKKSVAKSSATVKTTSKRKTKKASSKRTSDPARNESRKRFSEQFIPYILGAVAIFLLACFVLHFIRPDADPTDHLMGPVGYGICYFLFGLFGWVALLLPVLLGALALLWRRFCRNGTVIIKSILTAVTLVFVSAVIHVFVCGGEDIPYAIDELYTEGASLRSGGVIGGLLGWLLYMAIRLPGTIVLAIVLLPLLIMLILDMTPAYVFVKIKKAIAAARARAAADKEAEDDDDEPALKKPRRPMKEASEDDLYVPAAPRNARAGSTAKKAEKAAPPRRTVHVDTVTGEILDGEEDGRDTSEPMHGSSESADDRAPWEGAPTASTEATATLTAEDSLPSTADEDGDDAEDAADALYIPPTRIANHARTDRQQPIGSMVNAAYDQGVDDEDEPFDTMEISMDDTGREQIVVNVLPQDHSALRDSSDYHVNGLADEETVLPSGHTDREDSAVGKEYTFPPIDLLTRGPDHYEADEAEIIKNTQALRGVLESFHIRVKDIACSCGPTITRYEVKPDVGIRVRSIANLVDDIALGLAKSGVRIEAPIPGKSAVGIEVPNANPATVALRNLLETPEFIGHKSRIAACLGADVAGRPIIMDINKMPHMLIAGATGSGKSVCINSIIISILYKSKPEDVKLILIDPKKVEFAVYRDLPHLYAPIVSDPKKAAGCLNSAVNEMERRFELIEEVGVRNLAGYNEVTAGDPERPPMPQMVIIIDELADLMMTASNEVETAICRLAQKARAAGIHLILGTQRPSTDVITGLIKANIPSRIAFTVASQIDSRTIIDTIGAEKLIGRGDMLYAPVGVTKPLRVQGAFVSDGEVEKVTTFLKEHNERVPFDENFMRSIEIEAAKCGNGKKGGGGGGDDLAALGGDGGGEDAMFWDAVEVFVDSQRASTSLLQRRFGIGYGKAAKLIDQMEEMGLVGPADGNKPRKMLITKQELMELRMNGGGTAD